ncbi:hypothetical protein B566_EDAN006572 [Ephemera danica]|nr:hypothetical protein B566_EDAN006572 [Ephemera danica]
MSQLHVSLAIWLHMKFASRVLVDMISSLGLCASYAEVQRFELSATKCPQTIIDSNAFLQFAFDNADINKQTLTGHDTFHNMGGIMCVTPATAAPKLKTLRRIKSLNITEALNDTCKIPIFHYLKSFKSGLRNIVVEGINFHDDFDVDNFLRVDFLSLSRSVISCASPSWSGFMQIISRSDRSKDTTAITFLPFINLTPSNPSCIYTALKFAAKECVRHGQNTAIVTFDQPLFYKAMDIVSAMQTECELKNVIIRLGGFHFLMSFLGAIGYIMAGSGIEELFSTVYATNSVPHILTGKNFSRSIRAHLLASEALIATIFNESEHSLQSDLDEAKEIVEHLMENKILSSDAIQTPCILKLSEFVRNKLSDMSQKKRTSKLWSQYLHMVTLIRLFIRAERTGDWKLHMYCVRKMLPFLAAAGHLNYTKCAYLYYQSMQGLQSKMSESDYEKFVNSGYFTIRRTEIPWSGVWSDMIIEQSLMRSIKSVGGISHGRGYSESVLCKYINSLPVCAQFSECLEKFTGIESKSSEQHKDLFASRNKNDIKHVAVFAEWLKLNSPFSVNTNDIISLSTGAVGDSKINCELSEDIGTRILNDMKGKNFADIHIRRNDKTLPLAAMYKAIKIDNDIVPINTNQIIHRMMCLNLDKTDQKASMCFELAAVSTALFDENGTMRRGQKSKLQELLTTYANEEEQSNNADIFVIDGGFLLHKLCWPRPATWNDIFNAYVDYVIKYYGTNSIIVFDGYEKLSTKNQLQQSRMFQKNKSRLIEYLKSQFETSHINVCIAESDADELIAKSALVESMNQKNVCVVCNDTDILVILLSRATADMKLTLLAPGNNGSLKLFNIPQIQNKLGIIANCLPFIHAMTGCDTTSAPFMRGKKTAFELVHKFTKYSTLALSFNESDAEKSDIIKSGEKFMLALYNSSESTLDSARYHAYQKKVSSSNITAEFKLATLPPTSDAAAQHSLRVYLQVQQWLGRELEPIEYGWKKSGSSLVPVIMLEPAAPDQLLHLITCNCASDCSSGRCSCKKSGLFCTAMCGQCRGIDCFNNAGDDDSDQSDSDEPQKPPLGRKRRASKASKPT